MLGLYPYLFDEAPGKPRLNLKNKNASIYIIYLFFKLLGPEQSDKNICVNTALRL